jgi:hypothetical protein
MGEKVCWPSPKFTDDTSLGDRGRYFSRSAVKAKYFTAVVFIVPSSFGTMM